MGMRNRCRKCDSTLPAILWNVGLCFECIAALESELAEMKAAVKWWGKKEVLSGNLFMKIALQYQAFRDKETKGDTDDG